MARVASLPTVSHVCPRFPCMLNKMCRYQPGLYKEWVLKHGIRHHSEVEPISKFRHHVHGAGTTKILPHSAFAPNSQQASRQDALDSRIWSGPLTSAKIDSFLPLVWTGRTSLRYRNVNKEYGNVSVPANILTNMSASDDSCAKIPDGAVGSTSYK